MTTTHNVLMTLHPTDGAAFLVAADDAVSATVERSGAALLATVAVGSAYAATVLCEAATTYFLSRGYQPPSMARAVAAVDEWLTNHNGLNGTDHRLMVREGVLPGAV